MPLRSRSSMLASAMLAVAVAAAACGGGSSSTQGSSGTAGTTTTAGVSSASVSSSAASPSSTAAPDAVAAATARLQKWAVGTNTPPPSASPAPVAGKKVWVISCFELIESCSLPTAATVEAGKSVGWAMTVYDASGDPSRAATGIRNAAAAKADAIVLVAIDCGQAIQAIQEAKSAKVLIMSFYGFDCNDVNYNSGPPLFDGSVIPGDGTFTSYADFMTALATAKLDWVIAQTKGAARIIDFSQKDAVIVSYLAKGINAGITKNCPDCKKSATLDVVAADIANGQLIAKFQGALLQHADANSVILPFDAYGVFGLAQASKDTGRNLAVIGGEGYPAAMQQLRSGLLSAVGAISGEWAGYAAIDGLIRLFAGQPILPSGIGWQIITKANAPAAGGYQPSIDFRSAYKKIWGVK